MKKETFPMTSTTIRKKEFQRLLADMRNLGLNVTKWSGGYEVTNKAGQLLVRAMNGHYAYLVRYAKGLLEERPATEQN